MSCWLAVSIEVDVARASHKDQGVADSGVGFERTEPENAAGAPGGQKLSIGLLRDMTCRIRGSRPAILIPTFRHRTDFATSLGSAIPGTLRQERSGA